MWARFQKIDKAVDRFGYWIGAYTLLTGIFGWLSAQLTVFGNIRWPEAIFIGLGVTASLMLTASVCLALYRYFRPLPASEVPAPANRVTESHLQAIHDRLDQLKDASDQQFTSIDVLEVARRKLDERFGEVRAELAMLKQSSDQDFAQLFAFAVDEATLYLLDRLIAEAPTAPIPLDGDRDQRDDCYGQAVRYIRHLTGRFNGHPRGASILNIAAAAESEAERLVQEIVAAGDIHPAQVIEFRRYKIVEVQCQRLKNFLQHERAEVAERATSRRDALIERMNTHRGN